MNERDKEIAERVGLLGPSSRVGSAHEAAEKFATLIRADERKACAEVCDAVECGIGMMIEERKTAAECGRKIRKRGNT